MNGLYISPGVRSMRRPILVPSTTHNRHAVAPRQATLYPLASSFLNQMPVPTMVQKAAPISPPPPPSPEAKRHRYQLKKVEGHYVLSSD